MANPRENRERAGLELLYEISSLLAGSNNIETVLKPILDRIALSLGIIRGMITILNRTSGEIAIAEAWGLDGSQKSKGRYSLGEGITGQVIETGNPAVIKRISDEPRFLNRTGARNETDSQEISFVCAPICLGNEVIGAVSIDLPLMSDSLDYEIRVLTIVAASISQVVHLHQVMYEEMEQLKAENSRLHKQLLTDLQGRYERNDFIIGNSGVMQSLYRQIEQVSGTSATILLLGESGVGKERIARAIHWSSPRGDKPFVAVNCAAIPESLIESSLFGHEKGAFTGAAARLKGYFERADQGTIFFDEIGELPLTAQAKFLRVVQEREFERIGGNEIIKVNIRIIAATNRDMQKNIAQGKFREDLYYRLSVFPLTVPPLRERKADITLLAEHFADQFSAKYNKEIRGFSPRAVNLMAAYSWPGNVRELENGIERAVILSTEGIIHSYHLPPALQIKNSGGADRRQTLKEVLESVEKELIAEELRYTRGNIARAANNLGVSERVMGLRVEKYQIKRKTAETDGGFRR
jgi:Nif-specific regulatory protein